MAVVVRKVALALQEAHGRGIVHRDLKPANIMIDRRGEPIVMDFGLACRVNDGSTRLTQDGLIVGTPAYMSPEQIDHRAPVGPAADIYSLGVVLYELLTGSCPFQGNVVSVIGQVLHAEPKPVAELRPDVSAAMSELCRRAMAKDLQQRFASMKDVAAALTSLLKQDTTVAVGATAVAAGATTAQGAPQIDRLDELLSESLPAAEPPVMPSIASIGLTGRKARSRPMWVIVGAAVAAVLVVGGVLAVVLRDETPRTPIAAAKSRTDSTPTPSPAAPQYAEPTPSALKENRTRDIVEKPMPATPAPTAPRNEEPVPLAAPAKPELPVTQAPSSPAAPLPTPPPVAAPVEPQPSPAATTPAAPEPPKPQAPAPAAPGATPATPENKSPGLGFPPGQQPPAQAPTLMSKQEIAQQFQQNDRNGDGKLDPGETPIHIILRADKNRDHALTLAEVEAAYKRLGSKLFDPPTTAEQRKVPRPPEGRNGPGGGPGGPGGPPRPPRRGESHR